MSNIKITFHFHDVRAWPLNGGRAPSKLFNNHHTSLQSLLHSKTLVHSQNFRLQQPVSLYGTHTNNSPCRFFMSGPPMCVQFIRATRLFLMENAAYVITQTVLLSLLWLTFNNLPTSNNLTAKKQDIHNNSTPFSTIQHSNNNSNTIFSTFF